LTGAASHAAHPEEGRSPAPALARLIAELPVLAGQDELLTLTHARLGDPGFGTSPGGALLCATLRAAGNEALESLQVKAASLINEVAEAYGLERNIDWQEPFAAAVNHPAAVEIVRKAAAQRKLSLHEPERPFRWSEDFGCFTQNVPGALLCLGAGEACPPLHAGAYEFPDDLLGIGLGLWLAVLERAQTIRSQVLPAG
jgi:metal-dependent amidase/aminoacylase/carboxypeptidase family protein